MTKSLKLDFQNQQSHAKAQSRQADNKSKVSAGLCFSAPLRLCVSLLTLLLVSSPAFAQTATTGTTATAAGNDLAQAAQDQPFTASLLLIKADWSQVPAAKEIDEVLRKTLRNESVPKELFDSLPASAPRILFPPEIVSHFSAEHAAQLFAWLGSMGLVESEQPFPAPSQIEIRPDATRTPDNFGVPVGKAREWRGLCVTSLVQPYDFLTLPGIPDSPNQPARPFVTRTAEWRWHISKSTATVLNTIYIERQLMVTERGRGQEPIDSPFGREVLDHSYFTYSHPPQDDVAIVNAFPATEESSLRKAARSKGFEALIVVRRAAPLANTAITPRFHLPDRVEVVQVEAHRFSNHPLEPRASDPFATGNSPVPKPDETQIKVFTLRNARAQDAQRMISQLFARDVHSITTDVRTNSLIVRGPAEELNVIYAILTRLDELAERAGASQSTAVARQTNVAPAVSVENLTSQYQAKEQEAADLAHQIRELQSSGKADKTKLDKAKLDKLSADLRRVVAQSFAARQQLHQAEAAQLQDRFAGIQQNLKSRSALSQEIIDRRVKDLLNPDLQWEQRSPNAAPEGSIPRSDMPTASSLRAARAYRDKLRERWTQIENLYFNGRFKIGELLQAAKELGEAEVAAAATPAEILTARQQHLKRLQGVKSVFDARFAAEVEPENQKLAVDAEVLKAEAALAAESSHPQASPAQPAVTPPSQQDPLTDEETERIWNVLGVRVRAAKKEDLIGDRYASGATVTELRPGSPADGPAPLRLGDIIVKAGQWEVTSPKRLAFILTQPCATETITDGETKLIGLIEVQRARGIVQNGMQFPLGAVPSYRPGTADPAAAPADGKTATLRTPSQFQQALATAEDRFNRLKRDDVSRFAGSSAEEKTQLKEKMVRDAEQRLRLAQAEFNAQIRLLQLELQDAASAVSAAEEQWKVAKQRSDAGESLLEQTISTQRVLQDAQLREERAKTLLNLYQQVDPKRRTGDRAGPSPEPKDQ